MKTISTEPGDGGSARKTVQSTINIINTFLKRSAVMQATKTVSRILAGVVLCATVLMTEIGFSQDLVLNGNITNNGRINVARDVINNTTGTVTVSGTGYVVLQGTVGTITAHQIRSSSGSYAIVFNNLRLRQNRPTTLQVPVTVSNDLGIGFTGANSGPYDAGGVGFSIGTQTLTIGNTASYLSTSTADLTFAGGTVEYTNGSSQTILTRGSAGLSTTYGTMSLSGNANFTIPAGTAGTITAATVSHTGSGSVTVNETMNVTSSGSFGAIADVASGKTLQFSSTTAGSSITSLTTLSGTIQKSGSQSLSIGTVTTTAASGVIENTGTGTLTIATLSGNAGTIRSTSTGTVAFTNAATSSGTITTATGTLDFNNDINSTGTVSVTGAGNVFFGGSVASSVLTFDPASTATYDGAAQSIAVPSSGGYGNLVLDGSANKTGPSGFTVAGNLTLNRSLAMASGQVLTMTSTTGTNVSGTGEVTGSVRRNHTFTAASPYSFNRANVTMTFASTAAGDMTLTMTPATAPSTLATAKYVERRYDFSATSVPGNLTAMQLYYDETSEDNANVTNTTRLGIRTRDGATWAKLFTTGYTRDANTAGLVTLTNLNYPAATLAAVDEFGLYQVTLISAATGNWATAATWDEGVTPTNDDDVEVATPVTVAADVAGTDRPASVLVKTGGSLNLSAGSLAILGTLDVTNDGSITSSSGRTLSGTSWTNNTSGTSILNGDVSFTSLTNTAGTLTFNGGASSITGAVSNAAAGVINVGGTLSIATGSASTVTSAGNISVTGTGTLNVGASGVASSLNMTGTSTLLVDASANLNVFGNLELGSSVTLTNNGTITVGE